MKQYSVIGWGLWRWLARSRHVRDEKSVENVGKL